MELVLLPLLLLAGLLTTLDGGSDDEDGEVSPVGPGDGSGDGSGNDILTGANEDRIYGYGGDDSLTLSDNAQGLGGAGDDAITASDDAVGYGRDGDDVLTGSDNATVMGGEGDDTIYAQGSAHGEGGDGDDTLIAIESNPTLTGGAGNDLFVADWSDLSSDYINTQVSDFVAGQDKLAVMIGDRDLSALQFTVRPSVGSAGTLVQIDAGGDPEDTPLATFLLRGVSEFDLNDVVLYGDDLNDPLEWTADPAWTETLPGGAGADSLTLNDSQVGFGEGGDDTLIANDVALAYGGAGADSLTGTDSATLRGGEGNDSLTAVFAAEAHGEAGDDTMLSLGNLQYQVQPRLYGGDGNDSLRGDGDLYGGAGNDLIEPDADGSMDNGLDSYSGEVFGGDGDDTIRGEDTFDDIFGGPAFYGGAGNDLIVSNQGGGIDGGAGNDIVITRLHDAEESSDFLMFEGDVNPNYARTTLGAGTDVLALDLLSVNNPNPDWPYDGSRVIADFNPAQDELALILPNVDVGAFTASLSLHAPSGFMQLRLDNDVASMTLLLEGVTSAFPIDAINIYADEAAVIARTPYATL